MAKYAPEIPTIAKLEQKYPLSFTAARRIELTRLAVGAALRGEGFFGAIGPCAMTEDSLTIEREGTMLHELSKAEKGLALVHRKPPWKPRTNPEDWHGLETTNPETAYSIVAQRATAAGNVAIEIGHAPHLDRYGSRLAFGWCGSRNAEDVDLVRAIALHDPTLPVGMKNSMDGTIDQALVNTRRVHAARGDSGASAVLIYRGGRNAATPRDWERNYRQALARTEGRLIVDTAHGGEMAHHPEGIYAKSVAGQIACIEHVIAIADKGELPAGIMMEASDADSPTDPLIPFSIAIEGLRQLSSLRRNNDD